MPGRESPATAAGPGETSFIQLADPQFGMFADISGRSPERLDAMRARGFKVRPLKPVTGFGPETALFTEAIETANRLRPAFVAVCGDIVHAWDDDGQADEARRIGALLDDGIGLHWVAGNHDVGVDDRQTIPTAESLARYRAKFGPDNYTFRHGDSTFIVLNSSIMQAPQEAPDEWLAQRDFLGHELAEARRGGSAQIILFTHIPLFLRDPEEDNGESDRFAIPLERRRPVLELLRHYGAGAVFAGHMHANFHAHDGRLQMIASGPVGYPLGDDGSGYREVHVTAGAITHRWSRLAYRPPFADGA